MKQYKFECYFKNPLTGESGWDIKFICIFAIDKVVAKILLRKMENFDCIILYEGEEYFNLADCTAEEFQQYKTGYYFYNLR